MTRALGGLAEIADRYDAVVFDQWGVLHDGTAPYPGVPEAVAALAGRMPLGVLSNSGKRADFNAARMARMGYPAPLWTQVMTSGEALWRLWAEAPPRGPILPIEAAPGDARAFAEGLDVTFAGRAEDASAILLMGLPEGSDGAPERAVLDGARALPLICTNPDRESPRAHGRQVGPGALAQAHAAAGGDVTFYGKPHRPVFDALARALGAAPERILMVGDSLEHDVAGARAAGWDSVLVQGGLGAGRIDPADPVPGIAALARAAGAPMPDYTLAHVR